MLGGALRQRPGRSMFRPGMMDAKRRSKSGRDRSKRRGVENFPDRERRAELFSSFCQKWKMATKGLRDHRGRWWRSRGRVFSSFCRKWKMATKGLGDHRGPGWWFQGRVVQFVLPKMENGHERAQRSQRLGAVVPGAVVQFVLPNFTPLCSLLHAPCALLHSVQFVLPKNAFLGVVSRGAAVVPWGAKCRKYQFFQGFGSFEPGESLLLSLYCFLFS